MFTLMLVNVLLLMFKVKAVPALLMKVIAAVPETVWPKLLKLFAFTFIVVVAFAVVPSITIPWIIPAINPLLTETELLLIVFTIVPVGALEKAGTKIPLTVPAVTPPFELVIEL